MRKVTYCRTRSTVAPHDPEDICSLVGPTQQVADHAAEAEALRRLIKLKTKELKHVRHLAQEVLLQRSDVEVRGARVLLRVHLPCGAGVV